MHVVKAAEVHSFYLPEFSRRVQVQIWPHGDLSPERFVDLAKARDAQIGSCIQGLTRFGWQPIWSASWVEGGCEMRLNGPTCPEYQMRSLQRA